MAECDGGVGMFDGMERIELDHEGTRLCGYVAVPDTPGPAPALLVMHSALGIAHAVNERTARKFAALGYVAICTDMYGAHLEGASMEVTGEAFFANLAAPDLQRARTVAWFEAVASRPDVDEQRIAAVGFCYGGNTVLELARSGANLKVAVSYHGVLNTHARAEPGVVGAHVVAYCGAGDPYSRTSIASARSCAMPVWPTTRSRCSAPRSTASPTPTPPISSSRGSPTTRSRTSSPGMTRSSCCATTSVTDATRVAGWVMAQSTIEPYISPRGSAISSIRSPSGPVK